MRSSDRYWSGKGCGKDRIEMPKGMKEAVREIAKQQGQSFNEYVCAAIKEKVQKDTGEELAWEKKR